MVESVQNDKQTYLSSGSSESFKVEGGIGWKGCVECMGIREMNTNFTLLIGRE
jgi:hypothetical protein